MEELITFKNVKKTYIVGEKKFNALDGVNFSINKGEFVVILGPSGAGKSTLLNLLGGMDKVTSGKIKVGEEVISDYSDSKLTDYRAENVGFIFQFYNILPTLTVLENVKIVNDIVKKPKNAKEVLKSVGLDKHAKKFPNQLSGGEQQRVSIARAIAKDPLLLLCDEPTGALDSKTGVEVVQDIASLKTSMESMLSMMKTMITLIICFAILLGAVIIYNMGILSYSEKQYQFATLKVLGFKDKRIKKIFIEQNIWIAFASIIIGLPSGYFLTSWLFKQCLDDNFDFNVHINISTYLIATIGTFLVAYLVSKLLAKKINKIDMVSSLKGNE